MQVQKNPSVKSLEIHLVEMIQLKQLLSVIEPLRAALHRLVDSERLDVILSSANDILSDPLLDKMRERIEQVLEPGISIEVSPIGKRNQRLFAVRAKVHGLLDMARQTYSETLKDIYQLVQDYSGTFITNWRSNCP